MSVSNSATMTVTTDNTVIIQLGHIPSGPNNVQVTSQGKSTNWATDSSIASQPHTITVPGAAGGSGTTNSTAVSAVGLLTPIWLAFLPLLLSIRARHTTTPPQKEEVLPICSPLLVR